MMKVSLASIGNSKGIRIPRSIIEACGFGNQIEMRVDDGVVVLSPVRAVRRGWNEAFERMAAEGDDVLLLPEGLESGWDAEEWEW